MTVNERPRIGELEASQQTISFLEALLRASAYGIVITDATQNIVVVNEAFCAFFDERYRDVIGTSLPGWIERHDGEGYPKGLKGSEIPLGAGIIAVADAIDVMLSNRSYKNPFDREHVRHELIACSGKQFNPPVVEAAIDWLDQQPTEGPW